MTDIYYTCTNCKVKRKAISVTIRISSTEFKCSFCTKLTILNSGYT